MFEGTTVRATVVRVVDGDTVRVRLPGQVDEETLRLLCLDTEECRASGSKPQTPWGCAARDKARTVLSPGDEVTLEFPGTESYETCLRRYRGNYGRLLVFLYKGDVDYQSLMIREGYSPYYAKYGFAAFPAHHARYTAAERAAQRANVGVWNQQAVNGAELRNYGLLSVWWQLRARTIEAYRRLKVDSPQVFNTRLDYSTILEKADLGETVTIFTELRDIREDGRSALITIASIAQPFTFYIPDIRKEEGAGILNLLRRRYTGRGDNHPGLSYAYVRGPLSLVAGKPQMVLARPEQITDEAPRVADLAPYKGGKR